MRRSQCKELRNTGLLPLLLPPLPLPLPLPPLLLLLLDTLEP